MCVSSLKQNIYALQLQLASAADSKGSKLTTNSRLTSPAALAFTSHDLYPQAQCAARDECILAL